MRAVVPWQPRVGVFLADAGESKTYARPLRPALVTGPRQVGSSVRRAADVIGSAGPGRSRHFRGQTRYERRSRSPVESQSCSNGHLRSGEGAPSATADSHTAPEVKKWLAHKDPAPLALHFTPTSSSWLNLIERWFKELNDKRLRRGVFTSVADLTAAITEWAEHWNTDPKPFVWKATAEQIITKVRRGRQSPTRT